MVGWFKRKRFEAADERQEVDASRSFLNGAYRLHRTQDVERFTALAVAAFPEQAGRITCLGSSWLGCQFAIDESRIVNAERQILLLEPGTGEALEIPCGYDTFHSTELLRHSDAVAAVSFLDKWLSAGGTIPPYGRCVGYKKPLYLSGEDEVTNLHLTDFEVYWALSAQILEQVRGLPQGTKIAFVSISD
jgi:hypothetical protein